MRDVSDRVRAALPAALATKLGEIERALGRAITFLLVDRLRGGAQGSANLDDGVIKFTPQSIDRMSVIGEEIMHLHRWIAERFPATIPLQEAIDGRYASGLLQIAGHFDEHAFFPFLQEIGLDPRGEVGAAMQQTATLLEREIPNVEADGATDYWRVVLSAIYVQAHLIAPHGLGRDAVLRLFERRELLAYARSGQVLSDEISAARDEAPEDVERRVLRCLHEHLRLPHGVVSVTRAH